MLIGLLAPSVGPNLVFVTELIGAYVWTSFALVVATALLQRGGWRSAIILSPLLLTAGAWTLIGHLNEVPSLLQIPVPSDLQTVGLRGSLAGLYWPEVAVPWHSELDGSPANIWKPPFPLAYALAFIVLGHVAARQPRSRLAAPTLAALVGFLGIVAEELALLVTALWVGLEALRITLLKRSRRSVWGELLPAALGPVAAVVLLAVGGGSLTAFLTGAPQADVLLGGIDDPWSRQPFGHLESLHGRIGLLGVGAISAALVAALLAWRDRLVMALAVGTLPLLAAALTIEYPIAPHDVTRFDGHARNFALLALLLAVAGRLPELRPRWRITASAALAALVVWPTVALPVRTMGLGVSRGVQLTNSQPGSPGSDSDVTVYDLRRFVLDSPMSAGVAAYIRDNTQVNARIFSPHPNAMSIATGRPNASGLAGHLHLRPLIGPEFDDVLHHLEPGPLQRRGFSHVHATNAWIKGLPVHAQRWLSDPRLFERVFSSQSDALFLIQPAFRQLDAAYSQASFETLRQTVPASAAVYLSPNLHPQHAVRLALALSHTQLLGSVDPTSPHLMTQVVTESLSTQEPDLVVMPARMAPSAFPPTVRDPIWWNHEVAVYAPDGALAPIMDPPPQHFSVRLSDVQRADRRIAFTATFTDRATDLWRGQDWVVVATDDSPWRLPYRFGTAKFTSAFAR